MFTPWTTLTICLPDGVYVLARTSPTGTPDFAAGGAAIHASGHSRASAVSQIYSPAYETKAEILGEYADVFPRSLAPLAKRRDLS